MKRILFIFSLAALLMAPLKGRCQTTADTATAAPAAAPTQQITWLDDILPVVNKRVSYEAVVDAPGATKAELQNRFRKWFATAYSDAKDAIQLDDKESGEMICRISYTTMIEFMLELEKVRVSFATKASFKDGKYRYEYSDFAIAHYGHGDLKDIPIERYSGYTKNNRRKLYRDVINPKTVGIIKTMLAGMAQPTVAW